MAKKMNPTQAALFRLSMAITDLDQMTARDVAGMRKKYPKIMNEIDQANAAAMSIVRAAALKKK